MKCPCGNPARISGRGGICAVCRRAEKHAREQAWRIERAYQQARRLQRERRAA
jgi:hypothetical protein